MATNNRDGLYNARYGGPQSGSTPADDSDLHTSGNPYNPSSPASDLTGDTGQNFGPVGSPLAGLYTNPPASGGNPHSQGAAGWAGGCLDCDSLYADMLNSRVASGDASEPHANDVYSDEGYGATGTGRS